MISSRSKKPEINTAGFDEVKQMNQSEIIAGTPHVAGLCGSFSSLLIRSILLKQPDLKMDLPAAVKEEKDMIEFEKNSAIQGADHYPFAKLGLASQSATVKPDNVATFLDEEADAASISYLTSSNALHSLAYARDGRDKCVVQDSNRFTATAKAKNGSCLFAAKLLQDILSRSEPRDVKVAYVKRHSVVPGK